MFVLTFDDYQNLYRLTFPLLKERGLPFTLHLATESVESGRPLGPVPGAEPLAWEEVAAMCESGLMTVGIHTHSHRDLRRLDTSAILEELKRSDDLVDRRLGLRPLHFPDPGGYWSAGAESPGASSLCERSPGFRLTPSGRARSVPPPPDPRAAR